MPNHNYTHCQQPHLACIQSTVIDVEVGQRLCPVELRQSWVDALVQKLDALTKQPQLLLIQSTDNPVATFPQSIFHPFLPCATATAKWSMPVMSANYHQSLTST